MVLNAASEQTKADNAVADDHDRCKHRIARQALRPFATGEHHRNDQGNFNNGDRQRQHQRTEGFADAMSNNFGVINGDQHGANQG